MMRTTVDHITGMGTTVDRITGAYRHRLLFDGEVDDLAHNPGLLSEGLKHHLADRDTQ